MRVGRYWWPTVLPEWSDIRVNLLISPESVIATDGSEPPAAPSATAPSRGRPATPSARAAPARHQPPKGQQISSSVIPPSGPTTSSTSQPQARTVDQSPLSGLVQHQRKLTEETRPARAAVSNRLMNYRAPGTTEHAWPPPAHSPATCQRLVPARPVLPPRDAALRTPRHHLVHPASVGQLDPRSSPRSPFTRACASTTRGCGDGLVPPLQYRQPNGIPFDHPRDTPREPTRARRTGRATHRLAGVARWPRAGLPRRRVPRRRCPAGGRPEHRQGGHEPTSPTLAVSRPGSLCLLVPSQARSPTVSRPQPREQAAGVADVGGQFRLLLATEFGELAEQFDLPLIELGRDLDVEVDVQVAASVDPAGGPQFRQATAGEHELRCSAGCPPRCPVPRCRPVFPAAARRPARRRSSAPARCSAGWRPRVRTFGAPVPRPRRTDHRPARHPGRPSPGPACRTRTPSATPAAPST